MRWVPDPPTSVEGARLLRQVIQIACTNPLDGVPTLRLDCLSGRQPRPELVVLGVDG